MVFWEIPLSCFLDRENRLLSTKGELRILSNNGKNLSRCCSLESRVSIFR